jgi:5-methyltetrahydrofolate--homocysteine methyltransferase
MRVTWLQGLIRERPLIFDGAMGSNLERLGLHVDDFGGHPGCNEVLVRTRPALVQELHQRFLAAGSQVIETNSFGASPLVLEEHGLAAESRSLNRQAAALAREVAQGFSSAASPRYVAGSMGPGRKLPSLGQIGFGELRSAYREQAAGLLEGGVDLLAVETCQDLLQARAAVLGIRDELRRCGREVPILISLTLEPGGTLLAGADLGAALAALLPLEPDLLGLNCALGPLEMKRHLRFLAAHCPIPLLAQPNAGLPENVAGHAVYPLTPDELALWLASFVEEEGVQVVGGCCGTTPEHLAAVVQRLSASTPARRAPRWEP